MVDQNLLLIAYIVPIVFGLVLMTKAGDGLGASLSGPSRRRRAAARFAEQLLGLGICTARSPGQMRVLAATSCPDGQVLRFWPSRLTLARTRIKPEHPTQVAIATACSASWCLIA